MIIKEMNNETREFNPTIELKDNAMLKARRGLFYEWDFIKNDEIRLDVYKVTKGTHKIAWWLCLKCESSYDMSIAKKSTGRGCPYCSGYRVNHTNSLAVNNPNLAAEWHPTENGTKTPFDATCNSNKSAHWICKIGHVWKAVISSRHRGGHGCPYCTHNPKLLVGFSDMWTTNPKLASMLANPDDGYKYTDGSDHKVDWKCPDCYYIIQGKPISFSKHSGVSCPRCSDGVSYPEKLMIALLKELGIFFVYDNTTKWSCDKRYDFYIPSLNMIIEVHGIQHYEQCFEYYGGRTLEEEQENDCFKHETAMKNGIENYIVIDARYSKLKYVKNSILESDLNKLFNLNNIDWDSINLEAQKSRNIEILNLWEKGMNVKDISKTIKISQSSVYRILHNFEVKHFNIQ